MLDTMAGRTALLMVEKSDDLMVAMKGNRKAATTAVRMGAMMDGNMAVRKAARMVS